MFKTGQAPPRLVEDPWRGLLVPLTGLFRGCEGRFGNAGTARVFQCDVRHSLVGLALHGRCIRLLHLEPIGRAAGAVGRVLSLRNDVF